MVEGVRGKIDTVVALVVGKRVANGYEEEGLMGMGDGFWGAGCAGGKHELCHVVVISVNTNTAAHPLLYNLFIGLHACRTSSRGR